jgi:hypothetical protein
VWRGDFRRIEVSDTTFDKVYFPANQVRQNSFGVPALSPRRRRNARFDVFARRSPSITDSEYDAMSCADAARREVETLTFLASRTDIRHNKRDVAQLKYLRALAETRGWVSHAFVAFTGAFIKPIRFVLLSILTIALFAVFYRIHPSGFGGSGTKVNTIWDALYFSGVTFTTIGYGDITPLGALRALTILEGLIGIVLSSSFVVSIVRRYIE